MGHERLGVLPRTKKWRDVVAAISTSNMSDSQVSDIAKTTIENVRSQYRRILLDDGVKAAFEFLVIFSIASRFQDPSHKLYSFDINVTNNPTPLSVAKAAHQWVTKRANSLEYAQLAKCAVGDAIVIWHKQNQPKQERLFKLPDEPFEIWRKAGKGSGFCELSRLFFAKFTERYLKYFLDREASSVTTSVEERNQFQQQIERRIDDISNHAFETSKITQSYAAGWFNKYAKEGIPDDAAIEGFLEYSFGKMREELLREGLK